MFRDDPLEFRYEDDRDSNDEDNSVNEYPDEDIGLTPGNTASGK